MLREWIPRQEIYLKSVYAEHAEPPQNAGGDYVCAGCAGGGGIWRCKSCLASPIYCAMCCRSVHRRTPFHRIEKWNIEGRWEPSWLNMVDIVVHLGHGGESCPVPDLNVIIDPEEEDDPNEENADEGEENTDDPLRFADRPPRVPLDFLTIVDVSGVHELQVQWCGCPHALPPTEQLLNAGLFPSSQRVPRTCFTFRVLEDFLMDNLECKTTAMSYFRKLRRLTNTAFPYKVPVCVYFASLNYSLTTGQDRYLELIQVAREWNILQAKKNCGFRPESRGSPGDGELAHFCPACPQPGINLKEGWKDDPNKYVCAYATDIINNSCSGTCMLGDMSWMETSRLSKCACAGRRTMSPSFRGQCS